MNRLLSLFVLILLCLLAAPEIALSAQRGRRATIVKRPFGKLADGTAIDIYTLRNRRDVQADDGLQVHGEMSLDN